MDEFSWTQFTQIHQKLDNRITITASHAFGLTTQFCIEEKIDLFPYAQLFYDSNKKAVGIHFVNTAEAQNAQHKFKVLKSGGGGAINATNFFKAYKLDARLYKGRYEWIPKDVPGIGKMYVIILVEKNKKENVPSSGTPSVINPQMANTVQSAQQDNVDKSPGEMPEQSTG